MKLSAVTENFTNFKYKERLKNILLNGINAGITPIFSLLISLVVVRNYGPLLWGDFVQILLWLNIGAHLAAFGSKEFLLRKFSYDPSESSTLFKSSIEARLPLVIAIVLGFIALPYFGLIRSSWMFLWLFFRFIYQSYDVIIIWRKKFELSILVEASIGLVLLIVLKFWQGNISSLNLIQCFALAEIAKALFMIALNYQEYLPSFKIVFDITQLKESSLFFLIGFAGLLHSRVDQLLATHFLSSSSLAFYQILMSMLLLCQSIAHFILQPFVKNLYRLSEESINKIALQLLLIGGLLSPILVVTTGFILNYFYHFEITGQIIISGFIFIVPFFYSLAYIYSLYKMKVEKQVLWVNFAVIILNIVVLPFVFPMYGINGAIIFAASLQVIQAIVFRVLAKRAF